MSLATFCVCCVPCVKPCVICVAYVLYVAYVAYKAGAAQYLPQPARPLCVEWDVKPLHYYCYYCLATANLNVRQLNAFSVFAVNKLRRIVIVCLFVP